ncbi:uncharacterized protein [Phyllobates terribilis]|uniref:uncharacterized protein n=1 Tax=Phyllobates terribilis TaxID=111132 RepID=UPI003CCB0221
MDFVFNIQKTNEYFSKLLEIGNTHQTVFNYLKSLKRFLDYMKNSTDLIHKDKKVYDALCIFVDQLGVFQKRISKGISKENVAKKQKCLRYGTQTPEQLENILTVAKPTFMHVLRLAKEGGNLHVDEKLTILQYLEALIIVRKLQRPGVVQHMTVDEWKDRITKKDHVGITVYEHKTAANQVATVILTKEEESWFDIYFDKVRPTFLKPNKENKRFFISSSGEKIYNVSNDVARLHTKFGLKPVTSQIARRVAETFVAANCKESIDKDHFSKYLAHSNSTAERVYRENTMDMLIRASNLTRKIQEEASTSSAAMEVDCVNENHKDSSPPPLSSKDEEFKRFETKYPVTLEKEFPSLKKCIEASERHGRHIYDRWRKTQHTMRVDYIIGLFEDIRAEEEEVNECIRKQRWKNNVPRAKDILLQWRKR